MFDFHMHSSVSYDSQAAAEDMARAALKAGLQEICFTDHCDYVSDKNVKQFLLDMEAYKAAYEPLEMKGLTIRRGMEFGMTLWTADLYHQWEKAYPFDFIIGSVHDVDGTDPYFENYWTGDAQKDFRRYLEQTLKCVQLHRGFDVLGHLTYVCKSQYNPTHGPVPFRENMDITDTIMEELVRKDIGMEINTSGVDRAGDFLPSREHLQRFKELGGKIVTLGSDAHDPSRVGQYAPEALAILKDVFGYVCTFQNRQPVFHKL